MFGFGSCGSKHSRGAQFGFGHPGFAPPWAGKEHGCGGPAAILHELNLSDEQLEKAAAIKLEAMSACAQFKSSMGNTMRQIAEQLTSEQIDKAKIKEICGQMKEQKSQMGDAMLDHVISLAETLTPEQKKKLRSSAIKQFLGLGEFDE